MSEHDAIGVGAADPSYSARRPSFSELAGPSWSTTSWKTSTNAAAKNAVRTVLEGLRQKSTDGVVRTTSVSPGMVDTELADSVDNPQVRHEIRRNIISFAIPPEAVARAIALAIEQPSDVAKSGRG